MVYEADENGRLRQVERPSLDNSGPLQPLWKPQPSDLEDAAQSLKMTESQLARISDISRAWLQEKTELDRSLDTAFVQGTGGDKTRKGGGAIPVAALTQGMQGYAELSTLYNQRRESYWRQALAILTPSQLNLVEQVRKEAKR